MRRFMGGFTIVEVMIFLSVSGMIFAGAVLSFQGQKGKTNFEQGVRDVASKIQQYVDQVGTSSFPGSDQYSCTGAPSRSRPNLTVNANGSLGTNQGCIFLGRAIRVVPTQSQLFAYTVLGNQYTTDGDVVTSYANAVPTPVFGSNNALIDSYDTTWGTVLSSKITVAGTVSDSDLVGFYNSLQDGYNNTTSGGQSIVTKGYNFTSNSLTGMNPTVRNCIEELSTSTCTNTPLISAWSICFSSTGSNQTALLIFSSTPAGLTTDINFTSCT